MNGKIWRYVDFTKFVHVLNTESLFFSRIDQLQLRDPYEGSFHSSPVLRFDGAQPHLQGVKEECRKRLEMGAAKTMAVNCWHMNEEESMAMWQLYLKSDEGVAIQSTFSALAESFSGCSHKVYIGKVEYGEAADDHREFGLNIYEGVLRKEACYKHEQELRALIHEPKLLADRRERFGGFLSGRGKVREFVVATNGLNIRVDLVKLVKAVYVCPSAEKWFTNLVRSIVKKYEFHFPIFKSQLLEPPL
ncbi:MAG: hypothetical protein ACYS9T_09815 [Planctomycetota bacterium]